MKLAYKITLPLVILITVLILLVTTNSSRMQKEMIEKSQIERFKKIHEQFEKNRDSVLINQQKEIAFIASMAVEISVNYLYDFDFEALETPLLKLLSYEAIKAIEVYEGKQEKPVVALGKQEKNYKTIKKEVIKEENNLHLGYVKIYYDDSAIHSYFETSKKELTQQIEASKKAQDSFLDDILQKQIIFDLIITFLILIALLVMVYKQIIQPLAKLEHGLTAFFMFLQGKSKSIEDIDISSNDEFGKMSCSINENIKVSAKLHESIQELNNNLEKKVEERTFQLEEKTQKLRELLDNAAEGFLSFDTTLMVDNEYSKECENIFQMSIEGKSIVDLLHGKIKEEDKDLFIKMVKDIFNPNIAQRKKAVILRLFPNEFIIDEKSIHVDYKIIDDKKIMLILNDVTQHKILEEKIALEKKRLKMVVSVVSNLEEFHEMVEEFILFAHNRENTMANEKNFLTVLTQYYRRVHTFKGNFAQKELVHIVPKLHTFEFQLNEILKNPQRQYSDFKALIKKNDLRSWLNEDIQILKDILDERILENRHEIAVSAPLIEIVEKKLRELVLHPKAERSVTYEEILEDVAKMKRRSLRGLLSSYPKLVEQLAVRLAKPLYSMQILGDDLYVTYNIKPFIKSLVHLFRNSIDHGIETQEDRLATKKNEKGMISCVLSCTKKNLIIEIVDDGKGIDFKKIKKRAMQLEYTKEHLEKMSDDELLSLIFVDNFSTKEEITELSGRGIGLSAVKQELESLEGTIQIKTYKGVGTTFTFIIPLSKVT